jgi:hypothetical protein
MYTIQDVISLSRQLRMRTLLWLIPEALLLACVVVSFILRIQWLTSLISFSLGVVILFSLNMFILPLKHYKDFLLVALHGKTSRSTAAFAAFEEGAVMREGVRFYPLIMQVDTPREGWMSAGISGMQTCQNPPGRRETASPCCPMKAWLSPGRSLPPATPYHPERSRACRDIGSRPPVFPVAEHGEERSNAASSLLFDRWRMASS